MPVLYGATTGGRPYKPESRKQRKLFFWGVTDHSVTPWEHVARFRPCHPRMTGRDACPTKIYTEKIMKASLSLLCILGMVLAWGLLSSAWADVTQEWVARYNGPGNFNDEATSLAIDRDGKVYVSGYSYGSGTGADFATIKYNTTGMEQWVAHYNGSGNSWDMVYSLAVDSNGNVYITGASFGNSTDWDYATIKYDAAGVEQWVALYNGPANSFDYATSLAVDGNGNVYVTGASLGSITESNYTTIKYNPAGVQQWVARYNGPENYGDEAYSLALDRDSNVYVTGRSFGTGTYLDYATIKYNAAGVEQWVARYNGPGNGDDEAHSLVVDDDGNVYVTGWSYRVGTDDDYATIKYNGVTGAPMWSFPGGEVAARYDGPGHGNDWTSNLAVDGNSNVYVTGYSLGSGTNDDYATIKYNVTGDQQWVARYDGPGNDYDWAASLAVDNADNVYVTGGSHGSGTDSDFATIKYNTAGIEQWVVRYNGPVNGSDLANSLA